MATINYVKFLRGTPTAYANLATKDENTLYFISAAGATTGKLYLGSKEITGGSSSGGGSGVTTLAQLEDVITTNIQDKQILIYNSDNSKWECGFVSDIIDSIIDSNVLVKNDSDQLTLVGFASAEEGAVAQKGSDGKLKWIKPSIVDSYTKSEVDALLAGRLKRKKVTGLDAIDKTAADAEDYIYLVPVSSASTNNAYDEYVVVDGELELLNSAPVDLSGYVTTDALTTALASYVTQSAYDSAIGSISDLVKDESVTTLVGQVNVLTSKLTWSDMA